MPERALPEGIRISYALGYEQAAELRDYGMEVSRERQIPGFLVVYGADGMQLASEANGGIPANVDIALDKIRTVLAFKRSTSIRRAGIEEGGYNRADFAGNVHTLFSGGVAIFADVERTKFVGAAAFSGGTQEQDEKICRLAIEGMGLHTDLPKEAPQEAIPLSLWDYKPEPELDPELVEDNPLYLGRN
jgi:uncharacterized protein GlcG (DUF336 family)